MTGISKIPQNINQYAIQWAKKICNEPIEKGKGMDFVCNDTFCHEVLQESDLIEGTQHHVNYDFRYDPHDIFVHNHPLGTPLSIDDINAAAQAKVKKIFASTKEGYTSLDLTTIEESPEVSRNTMGLWAMDANQEADILVSQLNQEMATKKDPLEQFFAVLNSQKRLNDFLTEKLSQFANFTGAIFENVKWDDLK